MQLHKCKTLAGFAPASFAVGPADSEVVASALCRGRACRGQKSERRDARCSACEKRKVLDSIVLTSI